MCVLWSSDDDVNYTVERVKGGRKKKTMTMHDATEVVGAGTF